MAETAYPLTIMNDDWTNPEHGKEDVHTPREQRTNTRTRTALLVDRCSEIFRFTITSSCRIVRTIFGDATTLFDAQQVIHATLLETLATLN